MNEEQAERFVEENQGWLIPLAILGLCLAAFFIGRFIGFVIIH